MALRLLVSMGIKPHGRIDEPLQPLLVEVDADSGRVLRQRRWTSRHGAGPDVHQEFTAGHLAPDGTFWQPTHTELLRLDPSDLSVVQEVHHPLFHGLHSASPRPGGGVVLSAAGIESVLELDEAGALVAHHFLRDQVFADAYPGIHDFRTVPYDGFKPHSHHPNHAVRTDDALWVTCFETRSAHDLLSARRIPLSEGIPHDGRLREGLLWFTQVQGRVIAVDPHSLERVHDLPIHDDAPGLPGWCRGVDKVGERLFVGFTMLRSTRHREVARWLVQGADGRKRPTRVVEFDLQSQRIVQEIELGNHAGGTIYGIQALPDLG